MTQKQTLFPIHSSSLPDEALLNKYHKEGTHTDCYSTDIFFPISHAQYVTAFYTTPLFKLERFILKWTVSKPSTDEQAQQVAEGLIESFAAWTVEARAENQLLMCDFQNRTRSWFMIIPLENGARLYFGSAVVPIINSRGKSSLGFIFHALLGFHRLYSLALLYSAKVLVEALHRLK